MSETRTITTVPGIGDLLWIFMKLVNQKEKFNWKCGDGPPQRAKQIFELFPQLTESFEYIPQSGYKKVKRNSFNGKWSQTPQNFFLEANSHLEAGRRIEKFLPDLGTSYVLEYKTQPYSEIAFDILYKDFGIHKEDGKYKNNLIGIYTSSYNNSLHMSGWGFKEWHEMIKLIQGHDPSYKFVFLGAEYDLGISEKLMEVMRPHEYINTIGQKLPVVIEILKRLHCFIGFQSGLSIINETIAAKQTVMLYNKALHRMINTWPDPKRIQDGSYKGCLFCPPEQIFNWLIENKKI